MSWEITAALFRVTVLFLTTSQVNIFHIQIFWLQLLIKKNFLLLPLTKVPQTIDFCLTGMVTH